ncbi:hypothetical protein DL98DRAFT_176788 [Cadophora sp. DSE1049]|nr:hypothetical protein DL98DRAFT_176788 [Cadophora sp. DSE1049]
MMHPRGPLIFSDPGGGLVDQVLENFLAFAALATAYVLNSHNIPLYLWDRVLKESLARQLWHRYLFGCSPHTTRYWVVFVWRPASYGCVSHAVGNSDCRSPVAWLAEPR